MKIISTIKLITMCIIFLLHSFLFFGQAKTFILKNEDNSTDTLLLEFADEFEGNKLNENVWNVVEGVLRDPEGKRAKIWNSKKNIEVRDGMCRLSAKRDTLLGQKFDIWVIDGMKPYKNDFYFTTSEMNTKKAYGYGMYEMRVKVPKSKGLSPAFWMYGAKGSVNCEIDVFEFWNQSGFLTKFSKRKLSRVHNMSAHYNTRMSGKSYLGPEYSEDFYNFSVVWDECSLRWYVNWELKRVITKYKKMKSTDRDCFAFEKRGGDLEENVFPRDQMMNIIANLAVHTDEDHPEDEDKFPQVMEVDYIRYYKFK